MPEGAIDRAPSVGATSLAGGARRGTIGRVEHEAQATTATLDVVSNDLDAEGADDAARHVAMLLGAGFGRQTPPRGARSSVPAGVESVFHRVQRLAGNAATVALAERVIQRDPVEEEEDEVQLADVSVTGVTLTDDTVTVPLAGQLQATVEPANATGVTYSLAAGTATPSNATIDASTGVITIADGQQGGTIEVSADGSDGSGATRDLTLIERPGPISATETSGSANYGGQFTHTFSAPSGQASGLQGANVNEQFDTTSVETPWATTFELTANAVGSHGWDLDASGKMAGPDNVTIGHASVDVGKVIESTSNPDGPGLPQGFTMVQKLFATVLPGGTREATPFTTVNHVRRLIAGPQFEVSAGTGTITEEYSGPDAVTNAQASSTTVMASPPRPESGEWSQRKVTVAADPIPDDAALTYAIRGADLGCTVDADGEVSIGATAGSITVRVSGAPQNYDEVTITITAYQAPAAGSSTSEEPPVETPAPPQAPVPQSDGP